MSACKLLPVIGTFPATVLLAHPFCKAVPGVMTDAEFSALCVDIQHHGLREPITVYEGYILDGRARYQAFVKAALPILNMRCQAFEGNDMQALAYVLSKNLHRRTVNGIQKAIVGARMCMNAENPIKQIHACTLVGVSASTLQTAMKLLKSNNTPLIKRAEEGRLTCPEIEEALWDSKIVPINNSKTTTAVGGPVSELFHQFEKLPRLARVAFVSMAWGKLAPAITAAGKVVPAAPAPKKRIAPLRSTKGVRS